MIQPSDLQYAAIKAIAEWWRGGRSTPQVFYLAGFAGSGKTTVVDLVLAELRRYGARRVRTGAYTGKAANVLRKKGAPDPSTIHSMIYALDEETPDGEPKFILAVDGPASEADLILLDECSMVDAEMAADVMSFGKKILVMGDPGQLPPVGGHGFFTNREPDFFLHEVHRQAEGSPILHLATLARTGKPIACRDYGDGVKVLPLNRDTQHEVYRQDAQALCGKHTVRWTYTQRIRRIRGFEGPVPLEGETVINCKNDKERGLFNGGMGVMLADARDRKDGYLWVDVQMEDRRHPLEGAKAHPWLLEQHFAGATQRPRVHKDELELDWGYVLTCHKAQGSEWPNVVVVDDSGAFRDNRFRWLYTAITRASEGLTLLRRVG